MNLEWSKYRDYSLLCLSTDVKTFMADFGDFMYEAETKASLSVDFSGVETKVSIDYGTGYLRWVKLDGSRFLYSAVYLVLGHAHIYTYSDMKAVSRGVEKLRKVMSDIAASNIEKYHNGQAFENVYNMWKAGREIPFRDLNNEFRNLLMKAFPEAGRRKVVL